MHPQGLVTFREVHEFLFPNTQAIAAKQFLAISLRVCCSLFFGVEVKQVDLGQAQLYQHLLVGRITLAHSDNHYTIVQPLYLKV